jgi:hypothetical protein
MKTKSVREERGTAVVVGALYVLATAAGVAAAAVGAPTEVDAMAARSGAVLVSALLVMIMGVAVAGVGVAFYPLLARDAGSHTWHGAAFGFAGARIAEGAIFLVSVAATVAMLALADAMVGAEGLRAAALEAGVLSLQAFSEYAMIAAQTAFCVGAALMYVLLYRSRRVPRWLSAWGLVATPLMLVAGFTLPFTNDPNSTLSTLLYAPMGVQELVLAGWLIAFGFRPVTDALAVTT